MKVLKVRQIQDWDRFTIQNEPIDSIDLMERASSVFTGWLTEKYTKDKNRILIIVSKGNNGGDGLAVARMLADMGYEVEVLILHIQGEASDDFSTNLERLRFKQVLIKELKKDEPVPGFLAYDMIVDGIFGSGLTRPIDGYWAELIKQINAADIPVYAIDIPSGMFADKDTPSYATVLKATDCLSFEVAKLSFFFPSNAQHLIDWEARSIGLSKDFPGLKNCKHSMAEAKEIAATIRPRSRFDHKGHYGRVLIAGGQKGMSGAVVLATRAAVRAGAGLVYCLSADCNYEVMQSTVPEAMFIHGYGDEHLSVAPELGIFNSIGIGPGLGTHEDTVRFLEQVLETANTPLVLDADALNIISSKSTLLEQLPEGSILSPHPGEFERLFGKTKSDAERLALLAEKAQQLKCIIVLKGAFTAISDIDGHISFNSTGNPGMATGGSGDVLTGMIAGLLGQGYQSIDAARIGVFLHGLAGDLAAKDKGEHALIASDLVAYLPQAYQKMNRLTKSDT